MLYLLLQFIIKDMRNSQTVRYTVQGVEDS